MFYPSDQSVFDSPFYMHDLSCIGSKGKRPRLDELSLAVLIHYLFYIFLVFVGNPESYRSTGPHEPIGDCDSISYINTISGTVCACVCVCFVLKIIVATLGVCVCMCRD